ncbi:MAG: hypothetical protein K9G70_07465 [Prolixibacteraceae bacterium]|nr:hypothetical protein [Prolixibacteraceae bacterium]
MKRNINFKRREPINVSGKLTLLAIVALMWGCWENDDIIDKNTANGTTSLFGEVTEPEMPQTK